MTTATERIASEREKDELLKDVKQADQHHVAKSISMRAICVDRQTGDLIKDIELFAVENPDAIHLVNSYASPTPVIEEMATLRRRSFVASGRGRAGFPHSLRGSRSQSGSANPDRKIDGRPRKLRLAVSHRNERPVCAAQGIAHHVSKSQVRAVWVSVCRFSQTTRVLWPGCTFPRA